MIAFLHFSTSLLKSERISCNCYFHLWVSSLTLDKTTREALFHPSQGQASSVNANFRPHIATKYLFGNASKESIIEITQGKLYLVRPLSPKGTSELIFKDAAASIRRTTQEYHYEIVIQRAYEEGEAELAAEGDDEDGAADALDSEKDEKTFLLDQSLHFRSEIREDGEKVFAWQDLSGDPGDLYEFICDESIKPGEVSTFEIVAIECQYERKYRKPKETATDRQLQQFNFTEQAVSHLFRAFPSLFVVHSFCKTFFMTHI